MQYRHVGRSGLAVSVLGLGLGNLSESSDIDGEAIFDEALRAGVNLLDTADIYDHGGSERMLGRLIARHDRRKLVITTKVWSPMSDDCNDRGLSRKHLRESIEASLERLRTPYVDLYLCHDVDPQTPVEETAWTLDQLIRQGRCHYWGVSNWPIAAIEHALGVCRERGLCPPIVDESQYNLLEKDTMDPHIDRLASAGLGFFAWGPLASGVLTGKYQEDRGAPGRLNTPRFAFLRSLLFDAQADRVVSALLERARREGTSPERLAIAALLANDKLSSVILGVSDPQQLARNLAAIEEGT